MRTLEEREAHPIDGDAFLSRILRIYKEIRKEGLIDFFGDLKFEIADNIKGGCFRVAQYERGKITVVRNASVLPDIALKYVIAHELAHTHIKKHTKRFWKIARLIRVRAFKGGKTCEVPLSDELVKRIRYYIKRNRKKLNDYLFSTRSGTKINPNYLSSRIFKKLVKDLGIECRFHDFSRHSRITHLIKDGVSLEAVHKISRHRKLGVTLEYITLSGKDLRKLIDRITH